MAARSFDQNGKAGFQTSPAGNAVNLEDEMLKVSANQMDYAAVTSLYSKSLHLLKTAIGKGLNDGEMNRPETRLEIEQA